MRTFILFSATLLLSFSFLSAQTHENLDINQIKARANVSGDLFWDLSGDPTFEVPKNSGKHTLFAGNLWLGALDGAGQLRVSAQMYRQSGNDFLFGPHAQSYNSAYDQTYERLWKINQVEIDFHIANWSNPGYLPSASISDWPANGDITRGEAVQLAPFFDNDNNQLYDPLAGDYPLIRGDQAIFFMFSDSHTPNTESGGVPLGVEVHGMMYGYNAPSDKALDHTVFMHYDIFNRGTSNLNDLYAGNWVDFGLGFYLDDYIGCDSLTGTMYTYNKDNDDDVTFGYGLNPPAQGFTFLNHPMNSFLTHTNDFSSTGNPTMASHFYGYLTSQFKNSAPVVDPNNNPTRYMYSGDPVTGTGWTELSANNPNADRKGVGVAGPFTLNPGDKICIDGAYVFGRDSLNYDHLGNITVMRNHIQSIKSFYDAQNYNGCNINSSTPITPTLSKVDWQVYPNPANAHLYIEVKGDLKDARVALIDLTGRTVLAQNLAPTSITRLETGSLAKGIYATIIRNSENKVIASQKVVIE